MNEHPPQTLGVPAAADQVAAALTALRQQLASEPADLEGIGARCAEVLTAARQLERAAAADLRAAGRSWTVVGRALGMAKQSAHERFGQPSGPGLGSHPPSPRGPAAAPDRHRQERLTTPARDRTPAATGHRPAEADAPGRARPPGRRHAAGRQDPLTGIAQQPGQDSPVPTHQRQRPAASQSPTPTSAPAYDLVKAGNHATTGRWVVTVDAAPVGSVRRTVTARGTRQWTAWLGDTKLALHRAPRTRQDAAVQVLMAYNAQRSRRR